MSEYLSIGEIVKYKITVETSDYIVTNNRFIIKTEKAKQKGFTFEEYHIPDIVHINLSGREGQDYRIIGVIGLAIAVICIYIAYNIREYYFSMGIIGFLSLLGGVLLLLSKTDPKCKLTLDMKGATIRFSHDIPTSSKKLLELVTKINEQRKNAEKDENMNITSAPSALP